MGGDSGAERLELAPRWHPHAFQCIWTAGSGWGTVQQSIEDHKQIVRWQVLSGELAVKEMAYALPSHATVEAVSVKLAGEPVPASIEQRSESVTISLAQRVRAEAGQDLGARMSK